MPKKRPGVALPKNMCTDRYMLDDRTFYVDGVSMGINAVVAIRIVGESIHVYRNKKSPIVFLTVEG